MADPYDGMPQACGGGPIASGGFEPFIETVGRPAARRELPRDDLPDPDPEEMTPRDEATSPEIEPGTAGWERSDSST